MKTSQHGAAERLALSSSTWHPAATHGAPFCYSKPNSRWLHVVNSCIHIVNVTNNVTWRLGISPEVMLCCVPFARCLVLAPTKGNLFSLRSSRPCPHAPSSLPGHQQEAEEPRACVARGCSYSFLCSINSFGFVPSVKPDSCTFRMNQSLAETQDDLKVKTAFTQEKNYVLHYKIGNNYRSKA